MPVSVVIGGQFGSEGKGKVSLELARRSKEKRITIVRVGGTNSGHTGYDRSGKKYALRQLPAGCIDRNVDVVFPAGSYIDIDILLEEIDLLDYPTDRIFISNFAHIILPVHKDWEHQGKLAGAIGSTGSGVGGAVMAAVAREASNFQLLSKKASQSGRLTKFVCDTSERLRKQLDKGHRVIVEGTQGFGLSLLDGGYWPKATSRSTTAAGALTEAGLSPMDVDDVTMVFRSFPIRVAGDSGPLVGETTWEEIAKTAKRSDDIREYTTVTKNLRRVGKFDAELVRRALAVNNPTRLVMNHLDYVGTEADLIKPSSKLSKFLSQVERDLTRRIGWYGFSGLDVSKAERVKSW